jgi:hypothetical protein
MVMMAAAVFHEGHSDVAQIAGLFNAVKQRAF